MILDFDSYIINESSLKKLKKNLHGVLNMSARKRMRKELRDNIITFKFKKRNGEIRTAHGTLHPDYLPKLRGGAPRPEHQMVYYDLDKNSWRSFRSYSFIKIVNIKPVDSKTIVVKPHTKSSKAEDDEEVKNTKPIEKEEEKEVKRPVHKEEPEDKEVKKPEPKKNERDEDEDGEIDHTLPKFDYQDYKDKYVEKSMEDLGDLVDEYVFRFGYDGIEEYIDFDKVGEMYVDIDGPAHWLAYYDGVEREQRIDDVIYYIYRRQ